MSLRRKIWHQTRCYLVRIKEQMRLWAPLMGRAAQAALSPESSLIAGSISYWTFLSIFPLVLLIVAVASNWVDPVLAEGEIVARLEFVAPALPELLGANLVRIVESRGPVTGFAAILLLWTASTIFNVLTRALDKLWGANIDLRRSVWRHRGLGILMVLVVIGLVIVVLFTEGALLTILGSLVPEVFAPLRPLTDRFWSAFINIAIFALLYYFLPHVTLNWADVLPGAIASGLLWYLAKRLFLAFIGTYLSRSNLVYGSVAAITAFLFWSYVSSVIFLFGGYLNVNYYRARQAVAKKAAQM